MSQRGQGASFNPALSPTHLNVNRTRLARLASDHFPFVCELTLKLTTNELSRDAIMRLMDRYGLIENGMSKVRTDPFFIFIGNRLQLFGVSALNEGALVEGFIFKPEDVAVEFVVLRWATKCQLLAWHHVVFAAWVHVTISLEVVPQLL
jgi:hypothetical protein